MGSQDRCRARQLSAPGPTHRRERERWRGSSPAREGKPLRGPRRGGFRKLLVPLLCRVRSSASRATSRRGPTERAGLGRAARRRGRRHHPLELSVGRRDPQVAPALIAGKSIVLKPHEDTPLAALELAKLPEEAGVPPGVVNVVTGPGERVGEALVRARLTAAHQLHRQVGPASGSCGTRPTMSTVVSLEMGGKAPFIVMDDSDLAAGGDRRAVPIRELRASLYLQRAHVRR